MPEFGSAKWDISQYIFNAPLDGLRDPDTGYVAPRRQP
jgi:hypothetical protein